MNQRGRKSAASLAVVGPGVRGVSRLPAPGGLTDGETQYWLACVNSRPADWFGSEHIPLLVNYCRHAVRADVIAVSLSTFDPTWLTEDDGLKRYEKLLKMARDESTAVNNLARAMRMTHQSLYRADKAATTVDATAKSKPWQES
jgi:hypothetical protein